MPSWLIMALALVILVVGIFAAVVLGARRRTAADLAPELRSLRARADGLRYRLDASGAGDDEATRLVDTATAMLSAVREHGSRRAVQAASRTLDLAEAELDRRGR